MTRLYSALLWALWSILYCQSPQAHALHIPLQPYTQGVPLTPHAEYLLDASNKLTVHELGHQPFQRYQKDGSINLGYTKNTLWIRFGLEQLGSPAPLNGWILEVGYPSLDQVDVYVLHADRRISQWHTGDRYPFLDRPIPHRLFLFPFQLAEQEKAMVYVRVRTEGSMIVPLKLYRQQTFMAEDAGISLGYGIELGIILAMCLVNLLMFAPTRDASYLWLPVPVLGSILFSMSMNGLNYMYLFPDNSFLANCITIASLGLLILGMALFSSKFLKIKHHSMMIEWLLRALVISGLLLVACAFFYDYMLSMKIANAIGVATAFLVMLAGLYAWYKGEWAARFFLVGSAFFWSGMGIFILRASGIIPDNYLTAHAMNLGLICQLLIFSVAIGDKYRLVRKAQSELQQGMIELQQEVAELQEKRTELQQKLTERQRKAVYQPQEKNEAILEQAEALQVAHQQVQEVNAEPLLQNEEIAAQRDMLDRMQVQLEQKNKGITTSLNYASRIQEAVLPALSQIRQSFPDSFLLYSPRDIVSGDFYWHHENEHRTLLVAIDCTGHGVPGAFMSLLSDGFLKQIVLSEGIDAPDQILNRLNQLLRQVLRNQGQEVRDSMDLSVCTWSKRERILYYAGAKNALLHVEGGTLKRIKADNMSIGMAPDDYCYKLHRIPVYAPTAFYMHTDGFPDQFGGPQNEKFKSQNLHELLWGIHNKPMQQQGQTLEEVLKWWMQGSTSPYAQTDDILVIGFRVG